MAVALALILTMFIPSVAMAAVDYSYIKVLLASMGEHSSVQFKVAGAYRISGYSTDLYPGITYTMKLNGSGLKLSYSNGLGTVTVSLPSSVTFTQYSDGSSSNFLYINDPGSSYGWHYYSGNMKFSNALDGSTRYVQLINTVFIETYLYGVVAYEMGDDWPAEALKAQAVCARTYAMRWIKGRQSSSYHIDDTSGCQVYKGFPVNMPHVISAVDATRGQVLVTGSPSQTNLADGMYSASNGGQINTYTMWYGSGSDTYHVFKDDPNDFGNSASPKYTYYFPEDVSKLTTDSLKAEAKPALDLLKAKLPAALAQKGITCTADQITIKGVKSAVPTALRDGMPSGSKMYTQVAVTVSVAISGSDVPVAGVLYNGTQIVNGDATPSSGEGTDFGSTGVSGGQIVRTFTITNNGNTALTVPASGITAAGDNASDFIVSQPASTSLNPGESTTFTVTFDPTAAGVRTTTISMESSDPSSPYTFKVKGTGLNSQDTITLFRFQGFDSCQGVIDNDNSTVTVNLPSGTNITDLVAVFSTDPGATVNVGGVTQQSGITHHDFSGGPITYTVASEDNQFTKNYTVSVSTAGSQSSGGGGMPASAVTCDVTVNLVYISKSQPNGKWDTLGELRQEAFSKSYSLLSKPSQLWLLYQDSDSNFLYVVARGYGHGVGLSQRGAQQMAISDKRPDHLGAKDSYTDILGFYFNFSAGKASLATVSVKQKALTQIPGKGSGAAFGKVTSATLYVRAATNTKATVVGTLTKNTVVEYSAAPASGWYRILYGAKGLVGYVSSKYLKKTTAPTPTPPTNSPTPTPTPTPSPSGSTSPSPSPSPTATPVPYLGRVLASTLNVRAAANSSSAKIYTLSRNDVVTILDTDAAPNWYKIRYGASITGYCMYQDGATTYIEIVGTAPTANPSASPTATSGALTVPSFSGTANITSGTLSLRQSASTSSTALKQIQPGASFTILLVDTNKAWLKVKCSGTTGYVMAKYVKIAGSTSYHACTIAVPLLNVRSGAGSGNGVIGTLKANDTVVVLSTVAGSSSEKWYKIKLSSGNGYILVNSGYERVNTN